MNTPSQQYVTYVPFGSFQRPTPPQPNKDVPMRASYQEKIRDEVDKIRDEVISLDVKPLNPRPCFPTPAQVVPITDEGHRAMMLQQTQSNPNNIILRHPGMPYGAEFHAKQDPRNQIPFSNNNMNGDENFVYIHRQNSFIDVSKMTHRDHSNPSSTSKVVQSRTTLRSNDEFDAAMTLAKCLNS